MSHTTLKLNDPGYMKLFEKLGEPYIYPCDSPKVGQRIEICNHPFIIVKINLSEGELREIFSLKQRKHPGLNWKYSSSDNYCELTTD